MKVLINNQQTQLKINKRWIALVADEVLKFEGVPENSELSVVLCDDDFIQKLNEEYLGNNRPTDVLSFPMESDPFEHGIRPLGDVVISVETATHQAEKLKYSTKLEIVFLLIHGILHLLGYDHDKKLDLTRMKKREETICQLLGEKKLLKGLELKSSFPLIKRSQPGKIVKN
ncbi:rRNA maturation RNase YbeY [bacterium]|nr:rRNA maturation RNase YbeY [bacterium]